MNQLLTPCIVQTIIICCTIIIIALVILSGYRIHKQQAFSSEGYIFISGILTVLAIAIFSYAFYSNRTVLDFISLASALISIILAIVTIIYSFYTNGRSIGQAEKLQEAAEEVQKATKAYSESAGSLQLNIQKILNKIDHVEANTNAIYNNIYNVSDEKGTHSGSKTERFVGQSLNREQCVKTTQKILIFGQNQNESYCSGYLIASSCINLMEVQLIVENNSIFIQVNKS